MERRVMIAAHRGTSGANIIQNTIGAYENALLHGADILELDVIQTVDGDFFTFHNGQEPGLVGTDQDIRTMTTEQVRNLRFFNGMQERVKEPVNSFDDVLEHFKGKNCLINVDRSWFYWRDVIRAINRHGMKDQIILKSHAADEELKILAEEGPDIMYLPILRDPAVLDRVRRYKVNLYGAEVIFETEDHAFCSGEFIEGMHRDQKKLWVNALTLDDTTKLTAGHDDNSAILQDMDQAWGWLIDKGYDIIQTDWPLLLKTYINGR